MECFDKKYQDLFQKQIGQLLDIQKPGIQHELEHEITEITNHVSLEFSEPVLNLSPFH